MEEQNEKLLRRVGDLEANIERDRLRAYMREREQKAEAEKAGLRAELKEIQMKAEMREMWRRAENSVKNGLRAATVLKISLQERVDERERQFDMCKDEIEPALKSSLQLTARNGTKVGSDLPRAFLSLRKRVTAARRDQKRRERASQRRAPAGAPRHRPPAGCKADRRTA